MKLFRRNNNDRGATMVEYGLMVSVVALLGISAMTLVGERTDSVFRDTADALNSPVASSGVSEESQGSGSAGSGGSGATTTTTMAPTTTTTAPTTTTTAAPTTTTSTVPGGSTATTNSSDSEMTKWDDGKKGGGDGEWEASVSYENDWTGDQYLTVEVTQVDEKGRETTTTVTDLLVPAGGSAAFEFPGNEIAESRKGRVTGVMEVRVQVKAIRTTNANSERVTYDIADGEVISVAAPSIP